MQLYKLDVFEVIDGLPKKRKTIDSKIVFYEKYDEHGNLLKFKAQIVVKGFSQVFGKDFTNIFFFVVEFSTLQTFFFYIVYLDWKLYHINIVAIYLYSPLDKDIYMTISEGIEGSGSRHY